ncbi:MAG TPA: efflux RND transporter periplasmic adaptor subunit, partial [Vicinamibacteria bacterium]|nr:efflux RND transporter periplasmic adaptor subunit [Vicinamibacteria bacterium]
METTVDVGPGRPRRRRWLAIGAVLAGLIAVGIWTWRHPAGHQEQAGERASSTYYCPMHPSYKTDEPGNCPICSMKLVPLEGAAPSVAGLPAAGGPATAAGPGAATPAGVRRIRITPERQQQIGVKFAEARRAPATVETRAVGRVAYDETRIAHVHTKVSGWIEEVFVDFVGAPVKRGQPLFTLYSPDLVSSQEEYLLALRAEDELGGSSFARVSEGSRALVASARRRLELWDMSPEQIEALEKRGEVSRTVTVASPVAGAVLQRAAYHHGRTVTPELELYTIVDLSRVWVQASVYEYEAPFVRVGQAAEISLPYEADLAVLQGRVT